MARRVKCPRCGALNEKELTVEHSKRHYCPDCLKQMQIETKEYNNLYDYICELFEIERLNGWHFKQIKEFKEKYKYSYKQMRFVLKYFFEIKKNDTADALGIGIIPFVFDEASKYYKNEKEIRKSVSNKNFDDLKKSTTININKSDMRKTDYYSKIKEIDLNDIDLDEDD